MSNQPKKSARAWLREIAARGGKSRSRAKVRAARQNVAKARARR